MSADTLPMIESPPLDLSSLPDAETVPDDVKPDGPACPICGEPVPKLEGQKRRRKYHDACKPSPGGASSASDSATSTGRATGRGAVRAEKEADAAIEWFRTQAVRGCLMLSVIDRFDAFVVMVNLPEVCSTLRGVLIRYPRFRKEFAAMREGGSIFGLALLVVLIIAPIAAHHGLIPHKKVTEILVRLPFILFELNEKLKEGEAGLRDMMREMHERAKKGPEKKEGGEPASNGNASDNDESSYLVGTVVG